MSIFINFSMFPWGNLYKIKQIRAFSSIWMVKFHRIHFPINCVQR